MHLFMVQTKLAYLNNTEEFIEILKEFKAIQCTGHVVFLFFQKQTQEV